MMGEKESKAAVISAVGNKPLGLFALIVLVAEIGLGVTVKLVEDNPTAVIITIVGIILLLMLMVALVGFRVLGRQQRSNVLPTHGELIGKRATECFFHGSDPALDGRWRVTWLQQDSEKTDKWIPYQVRDEASGEMIDYPPDVVTLQTHGALISAEAEDTTTRRIYYLEGRVSNMNIVTLMYWSQIGGREEMLVGTLLLELKKGFKSIDMVGTWSGYDRHKKIVHGRVEWVKTTID